MSKSNIWNISGNKVRIGFIGLGQRGLATLRRFLCIDDAEVVALCDINHNALMEAKAMVPYSVALDTDWVTTCKRDDIDLIYLCTDWSSHACISIFAMNSGKNVACEIPASLSITEGKELLETVKRTGKFYNMMENCCYDPFALTSLQMVREGLLGEVTHCEGAYIHDLRSLYADGWYGRESARCQGNPYPTHGIGPICQLLGIGQHDKLSELVSMSSNGGGMNSTLIRTERGRTILLQFDVSTPRPYSRLQTICGTKGYISKYPLPTIQIESEVFSQTLNESELETFMEKHRHPWETKYRDDAHRLGITNMMNYIMDRRLIENLLTGNQPDISTRDAVLWSSIAELSHQSVINGSSPVKFPDFE